jgi:hypothetical protein
VKKVYIIDVPLYIEYTTKPSSYKPYDTYYLITKVYVPNSGIDVAPIIGESTRIMIENELRKLDEETK